MLKPVPALGIEEDRVSSHTFGKACDEFLAAGGQQVGDAQWASVLTAKGNWRDVFDL
jgi:putative alpha-1,2-mannosidase